MQLKNERRIAFSLYLPHSTGEEVWGMACVAETVIIILSPASTLQRVTDCNRGYKYIDNIRIYMCVCVYIYSI